MKKYNVNEVEEASPESPAPETGSDSSSIGLGASSSPPPPPNAPSPNFDASLGADPLGGGIDAQNAENKPVNAQEIKSLNIWDLLKDYVKNQDRQK